MRFSRIDRQIPDSRNNECLQFRVLGLLCVLAIFITARNYNCTCAFAADALSETTSEAASVTVPNFLPCAFEQITPGTSNLAAVIEQLGEPTSETEVGDEHCLVYSREPFRKVEVFHSNEVVSSIVLHLETPAAARQLAKELQIESFDPVPILGDTGKVLGRAYPERGVMMNFENESPSQVTQVILEPISAELFVLRACKKNRFRYQRKLEDLKVALQYDPNNIDALLCRVDVFLAMGDYSKALKAVEELVAMKQSDPTISLRRAVALMRLERPDDARVALKSVLDDQSTAPIHRARGECLQGDLLAEGEARDFAKAVQHHLAAVKTATPLASHRDLAIRRDANRILLDASLAAARDIAAGNWQNKSATVAKWLASARELVDSGAGQNLDEDAMLLVELANLASHAEMRSDVDPTRLVAGVEREVKRLLELSGDESFARVTRLKLAAALLDAASIEHSRDGQIQAFDYATRAAEVLESVPDKEKLCESDQYLIGRLYFFVGSSHAVIHRNHEEASRWYAKANRYLVRHPPPSAAHDLGRQGERLVSMGASYWETGEKEQAVDLTRRGMEMMKQAARTGLIPDERLGMPYGNLAAMYQALGKSNEAKDYAELATRASNSKRPSNKTR